MLRDLRVTTAEAEQRSGDEMLTLLGELEVDQRRYAEVGAPVPARVTRLAAQLGDRVAAGQTLAELSSPDLGRARADYLSARARLTLAEAALERKRGLAAERIVPLREVQEAESLVAEVRASLRSAAAAIGAFGVEPPVETTDSANGACGLVVRRAVARRGPGDRAGGGAGADAGPGDRGVPHRRPLDALAHGARVRA